jgi:hypothetical protein
MPEEIPAGPYADVFKMLEEAPLKADTILVSEEDHQDLVEWTCVDHDTGEALLYDASGNIVAIQEAPVITFTTTIDPGAPANFNTDGNGPFTGLPMVGFSVDAAAVEESGPVGLTVTEITGTSIVNVAAVRKLELYEGNRARRFPERIQWEPLLECDRLDGIG